MRPGTAFFSIVCALMAATAARAANATDCSGKLSPCIDDDTLWPHAGFGRFVAVGSTETVAPGQLGFGLATSYLSRPIAFALAAPGGDGTQVYAINDQVDTSFLWSYGVSDRLELDMILPLTVGQGGAGLAPVTGGAGLRDTAIRDLRFGFTYALVPHPRIAPAEPADSARARHNAWGLTARLEVSAPSGDRGQFAGERSGVFVPGLAADYRTGGFFVGAEVGVRIRPTTDLLGARIGTELLTALGIGYDLLPRELLTATVEAWALPSLATQLPPTGGGTLVPAEWQVSARTAPIAGGDVSLQLSGGGGIPTGDSDVTTPRFRFTLGVRWAPQARDTDGDGVLDAIDKCLSTPARGSPDGCPTPPTVNAEPEPR